VVPMSVSPTTVSVSAGTPATVTWTPPAMGTACTLTNAPSGLGSGSLSGTTMVSGPTNGTTQYQATYTSTGVDVTNGGVVTFTASCNGTQFGTAQLMVTN
jgi:hypothetical protein